MSEFDVVSSPLNPGLSVIEASAGTGKTYALSHLVPRLLLEGLVKNIGEIVLVTFTNDAARELSDRVRRVLEDLNGAARTEETPAIEGLRKKYAISLKEGTIARALLDIDQLRVSTIHSFCQRILRTEGALCGLPVVPELLTGVDDIVRNTVHEIWENEVAESEFVAGVATEDKWKFEDDLKFVKSNLADEEAEIVPKVGGVASVLQTLENKLGEFDAEVCDEIRGLLDAGLDWNKGKEPDKEERDEFLRILEESQNLESAEVVRAWKMLASLSDGMTKKSKEQKAKIEKVSKSRAVILSKEALRSIEELHWAFQISCLEKARGAVRAWLARNRQMTHDSVIRLLHEAVTENANKEKLIARLREQLKVALIDESQDTDRLQLGIFNAVFSGMKDHRIVLIGDPKQAIYAFRGADVNTYLDARDGVGKGQVFGLNKTYRAPKRMVDAWNAVFGRGKSLLKEGLDYAAATSGLAKDIFLKCGEEEQTSRMEFWMVEDGEDYSNISKRNRLIAEQVASEIVRILSGRCKIVCGDKETAVQPRHFAILVSDRYQVEAVEKALKTRKVPSVRGGGDDVLSSEEASDMLTILRALDDPRRKGLRLAALATRILGRNDEDLRKLEEDEDGMLEKFLGWSQCLLQDGAAGAFALMDREEGIVSRLANGTSGDRRVTNFRHLCDLLRSAQAEHGNRAGRLLRWFQGEVAAAEGRTDNTEREMQLESDVEAVRIITMHKAKGLEFDLVFCPFLWDIKYQKGKTQKLSRRGDDPLLVNASLEDRYDAELAQATLEERLRLAYVAVTRARVKVWIHAGEITKEKDSAIDWLLRSKLDQDFSEWKGEKSRPLQSAGLVEIIKAADGTISQCEPPKPNDDVWQSTGGPKEELCAEKSPSIPKPWYITSFSALTKEEHPYGVRESLKEQEAGEEEKAGGGTRKNPFILSPGGVAMGDAVHALIEKWDCGEPDSEMVEWHFEDYPSLTQRREDSEAPPLHEAVTGMLHELRAAELPGFGCPIAKACPDPKGSEWHFHLPISEGGLNVQRLAMIFDEHPQKGFEDYGRLLGELDSGSLEGFLQGFIDRLAIEPNDGNRWGVIDWKTNNLGKTAASYGLEAMRQCAIERHYFLQAHLYLVALRRYLAGTVKAQDAWIVFLRGVSGGTKNGILHIKPSMELLNGLDELFFKA